MVLSNYDVECCALIEEGREKALARDRGALPVLKRLKAKAAELDDPALMGYAEYYTASYYYDCADYEAFQKSLRLSIRHLLRSGEHELLARAYNFFALDAYSNESFDVAYSHYMSALQFAGVSKDSAVTGVVTVNLGLLFLTLKNHLSAREYFRRGIRVVNKNVNDPFYFRNRLIAYTYDGINSLALNDPDAAVSAYETVSEIYRAVGEEKLQDARLIYSFFEARLMLAQGKKAAFQEKCLEITEILKDDPAPYEYMDDIADFCHALIDAGYHAVSGEIIDAVDESVSGSGITHMMHLMAELKVDYYEATGDEDSLAKALLLQNDLLRKLREEQRKIYHYAIGLVRLVEELHEEEAAVETENERLLIQAQTDALTGIPNRYLMDKELGNAFERAYSGKKMLGIGILDVDDFKDYNDDYGHQTGDKCLMAIGDALRALAEDERVFCARYGGDEFVIVYEDMSDEEIRGVATRLKEEIASFRIEANNRIVKQRVSVSQGICSDVPLTKSRPWDFLSEADQALYSLKRAKEGEKISLRKLPDTYR